MGHQEEHRLLFYTLGVPGKCPSGFLLSSLSAETSNRTDAGVSLGLLWKLISAILASLGKAPATLFCCKITSTGQDQDVGGNGLACWEVKVL